MSQQKNKSQLNVLLLSPSFSSKGGVSNYSRLLIEQMDEINLHHFPQISHKKNLLFPFLFLNDLIRFNRKILNFKPHIIHVNPSLGWNSILRDFFFILIAKVKNIKSLLFLRGWGRSSIHQFFGGRNIVSLFLRIFFTLPDKIITLASIFRDQIRKTSPNHLDVELSTTMVSTDNFSVTKRLFENPKNILFCGRIKNFKGIYELLLSMPLILHHFPQTTLTYMGDGPELKSLRRRIIKHNLQNSVKVIGHKSGFSKFKIYKESDLFVLPSYNEGFPNVYCEALASGLPIVTTLVGGVYDYFEEGIQGLSISNPPVPRDIAKKIIYLFNDPKLMTKMGNYNMYLAKSKLDVDVLVSEMKNRYVRMANI